MKKTIFIVLAVATLTFASCKTDKCVCTIETPKITTKDVVLDRPEDKLCSQVKAEDVQLLDGFVTVDISNAAKVTCKNHHE